MEVLEEAARRGHKEVLQFLQEYYVAHRGESDEEESKCHSIPGFSFAPLNAALQAGQKELALWMAGKSCFDSMDGIVELLKNVAQHTDLEFLLLLKLWPKLKYLSCGRKQPPFPPRFDYAAEGDDIDLANWILDAGGGHLAVVKWLHDNRSEGCTTDAMDEAARNGHLDVVRWLHENRSEGCTTWAMDRAALRGDFDILLYLHYRRTEGCSYRDKYAAGSIVFWACDNLPEFCFHFWLVWQEETRLEGKRESEGGKRPRASFVMMLTSTRVVECNAT